MESERGQTTASQLAAALESLMERAFRRGLFPVEVRAAFAALDAYEAESDGE